MTRPRLTQSKIEKLVKAVAAACGSAQVVIEPDGTVRVLPAEVSKVKIDYKGDIRL